MKQDLSFWKPFFQGCLTKEIVDGTLVLNRFTEKQKEIIGAKHVHFGKRMKCNAGVILTMCGKLSKIKLSALLYAQEDMVERETWGIDIFVDGFIKHSRIYPFDTQASGDLNDVWSDEFELGDADEYKVVEILLPATVQLRFTTIEPDAEVTPIHDERGLYLAIGDSITQGIGGRRPWMTYPHQVAKALDKKLLNHGIGGYIFDADGIDVAIDLEPELITVAYGINDWWRGYSLETIEENCNHYFKKLRSRWQETPIYVITPIWCNKVNPPERDVVLADLVEFRNSIANVAEKYNIMPINGLELMPHDPSLLPDELHPNEEGYMLYSKNLIEIL